MSKPENIYYFKLSNGDDILADVVQDMHEESAYIIRLPMKLNYEFAPDVGRMFMGMSKWIPMMKSPTLVVYYDHVITVAEVDNDMKEFYYEALDRYDGYDDDTTAFETDDLDEDKVRMAMYLANTSTTLN